MTVLDGAAFGKVFDSYERSAWRFEAQPVYTIPGELLARFLAGGPEPPSFNEDWHQDVRSWVAAGKTIGRARVVRRPLTDYQRYQLAWGIPGSVSAGEDIRILDLTEGDLGLPDQDFWVFDESKVVRLNFNPNGTLFNIELVDNPDLSRYLDWKDTAMKHAVTLTEWNART